MNCICRRSRNLTSKARSFSTSAKRTINLGLGANDREIVADVVPAYPPGPTQWYKQSTKGLYGNQKVRYGNNTSEEFRTRTRRTWSVNVKDKRLYSHALGQHVKLRTTTRVMRTIDKLGGLDEYLLGEKEARIKELGETGWWLRWAIMQTRTVQERFRKEREALGLPPKDVSEEKTTNLTQDTDGENAPNPVLQKLDQNKKALKFRVSRFEYVQLVNGRWVRANSKRNVLIGMLKRLSPTASLKEWEDIEFKRSKLGKPPHAEKTRLRWFALRQKDYETVLKEYKLVDPAEGISRKEIEERHALDSAKTWLLNASKNRRLVKGNATPRKAGATTLKPSPESNVIANTPVQATGVEAAPTLEKL